MLTVGDLLEWGAAAALTVAAGLAVGLPAALAALGAALAYFAQCYDQPLGTPGRERRPLRRLFSPSPPSGPPTSTFHCAMCGGESSHAALHVCAA